jgi:hypothetical protein
MVQHRPQHRYEGVQQFFVLSGIASRPLQFIYQVKLFVDALLYRRNETVGLSKLILLLAFVGHTRILKRKPPGCEPGGFSEIQYEIGVDTDDHACKDDQYPPGMRRLARPRRLSVSLVMPDRNIPAVNRAACPRRVQRWRHEKEPQAGDLGFEGSPANELGGRRSPAQANNHRAVSWFPNTRVIFSLSPERTRGSIGSGCEGQRLRGRRCRRNGVLLTQAWPWRVSAPCPAIP